MSSATNNVLTYEGCNFLRQRLILSTISGKSIKIKKIRYKDNDPGVKDFEACLIRLFDKITNGSTIEVNASGTGLFYQPGMLIGGTIDHECNQRSIGYFLEVLVCLAPFMKKPLKATLRGITNEQNDPSVDLIKCSTLPVLTRFLGSDDGLELKVTRRGAAPNGGGEVVFSCPCKQKLRPIQFTDPGKVKRIRGVAWATRVSPATCNRLVDSARSILNKCLPDIYIYTDHMKGPQSGKSPGFGITLVAETTNGAFLCVEKCSAPKKYGENPSVPEDMGKETAGLLLEEIYRGGCIDSTNQSLAALMMTLGDKDVSKIQTGPLSPYMIQFLRHIRDFLQLMFKIDVDKKEGEDDDELRIGTDKVLLTCVGVGYRNLGKVVL